MKKLAALLLLIASFIGKTSNAQNTGTCNAEFNVVYQNANTVQFNPVMIGEPNSQHYWIFGDGNYINTVSPVHTYANPGVYTAKHIFIRYGTNGVEICRDSATRVIQIGSPTPCILAANFTISVVPGAINTYHFQNTTTPLSTTDSIHWTFGDGGSSNDFSPTHTYTAAGTYNVCLRVQQRNPNGTLTNCISEICHTIVVQTPTPCNLVASFTWLLTPGPNTLSFQNTTTGIGTTDSIRWTFGDGSSSNQFNPVHTYAQAGTYNVCLRVQKRDANGTLTNCISEVCHTIVVQSPACTLVAGFTATPITSTANTIHFENTSTPLNSTDSIRWTFGDGTSSNDVSPNHTYAQPGTYTVCLRVQKRNSNGTLSDCIREICHTVTVPVINTCTLVASFTATPITSTANTIHFENTSTPLNSTDSIRWTFGDGTSSNDVSPNHTYAQPGTYTVCLRVQKRNSNGTLSDCIREICHTVTVPVINTCTLVASFSIIQAAGTLNTFHFENTSTPLNSTDSIRWTFGDGTSSNDVSPNHTYALPGTYNVCLRVQKRNPNGTLSDCIREICHTVYIQSPTTCNLVANFVATQVAGSVNTYHFENTSASLSSTDSIRWNFGDGTTSNQLSPNHTYTQSGTYTVCLRVQKREANGTLTNCVREICHTVVVQSPTTCNIPAHFTWAASSTNPLHINFTNQTATPTATATAMWFFGDGTSASTWNAEHDYAHPGRYYVCLRVEFSPNCVKYSCDSITVQGSTVNCINQSNFTFIQASSNGSLYYFIPNTINTAWQYTWTFGDGTGAQTPTTNHLYAQPGDYTVCLTVYQSPTCASTTCRTIHATLFNCNNVTLSYTYTADPLIPNKLFFHAVSNYTITDQTWTIKKLPASSTTPPITIHQNNPYYIFQDTGYYQVCLRAVTVGGCVKETCQTIHITQVVITNACTLQPYPNPATGTINVNIFLAQPQMIDVYIYSSMNVLVREKHQQGVAGNNIVTVSIADLVAGTYYMKVVHGNDICYAQFVKL